MHFLSRPPAVFRCVYCRSEFQNAASLMDHRTDCAARKDGHSTAAKADSIATAAE